MADPQRIAEVRIGRGRPARWQAIFGGLVLGIVVVWAAAKGFPTQYPLPIEGGYFLNEVKRALPWYSVLSKTLLFGLLGSVAGFALARFMPSARRRGTLEIDDEALTVIFEDGSRETFARKDVEHVQRPRPDTLDVHLKNGGVVRVADVEGWRFRLPDTWIRGPGRLPIRGAALAEPRGCLAAIMWLVFGIVFLSSLGWVTTLVEQLLAGGLFEALRALGSVAVFAALCGGLLRLLRRRELVIGNDGVRIVGALRDRFVPFAAIDHIEAVTTDPYKRLRIFLRNGKRVHIPVVGDPDVPLERLRHALSEWKAGSAAPHIDALERGERNAKEWARAIRARTEDAAYREAGVRIEDLEAIVEDPRAGPEQRVGAGLALADDDEGRRRVRIAAEASADPDLKTALEAAAEGEVAERELERAAQRRARS